MSRYNYKSPRRLNWVSITILLILAGGAYAGWKFVPVYYQRYKVDGVLTDMAFKAMDLRMASAEVRATNGLRIATLAQEKIVALGVDDPELNVYISDDMHVVAEYRVVVHHPVGGDSVLYFNRRVRIPGDDRTP